MKHYSHSEGGYGHSNEDAVKVQTHQSDGRLLLCGLADGMGGQAGGGIAANWAVDWSLRIADEHPLEHLRKERTWVKIIESVDDFLSDRDVAGYTTLVCLGVMDDLIIGASCGDSMALLQDGHGGQHILTERQRKNPPVGSGDALPISFSAHLGDGWQVIVMSDGVWKYLEWDEIVKLTNEKRGFDVVFGLHELSQSHCNGQLWDDWSVAVITDEAYHRTSDRG